MAIDRRRFLGALLAGAVLALPGVTRAQDQPPPGNASTKLTLSVPGMTWPSSCTARVRGALQSVPGVRNVEVEFKKKEAYVTCDQTVSKAAMLDALKKAGYDATVTSETAM